MMATTDPPTLALILIQNQFQGKAVIQILHFFTTRLPTAMASCVHHMKMVASSHVLCAQSNLLYTVYMLNSGTFILYSKIQNEFGTAIQSTVLVVYTRTITIILIPLFTSAISCKCFPMQIKRACQGLYIATLKLILAFLCLQ